MAKEPSQAGEEQTVELKDPATAAVLAWLIPGLGHYYQGRTAKAILFFVCIMGTFSYGVYLGGSSDLGWGRVVYCSWRPGDKRLPYLCQLGVGIPALPALVQASRVRDGKEPWFDYFMAPPELGHDLEGPPFTLNMLHKKLNRFFEFGTVYTMVAGLLNILVVYDAWGGPVFSERRKEEDQADENDDKNNDDKNKDDKDKEQKS